jgi:hypothetical protein
VVLPLIVKDDARLAASPKSCLPTRWLTTALLKQYSWLGAARSRAMRNVRSKGGEANSAGKLAGKFYGIMALNAILLMVANLRLPPSQWRARAFCASARNLRTKYCVQRRARESNDGYMTDAERIFAERTRNRPK